ncbi:class I adenylate-forming enzyme family protein [Sphingomonas montana]|uniref:class I adenylate-forming enzyme family protein n=1 Tax=Sphingomonas montana TaxID=1843236 RepID=UPI0009701EBE|nr:class I adenylate-forming enzyme family protein [Sphingomonas montana]
MASELDSRVESAIDGITGAHGPLIAAPTTGSGALIPGEAIVPGAPGTLVAFFAHFCALHAEKMAVVAGTERLTFRELDQWSDRLAAAFSGGWGVAKGDRIAIAMRNCPSWIALYMGAVKAGAIATLVNGWWQPDELAGGIALCAPTLVIADAERGRRIAAAGVSVPTVVLPIEAALPDALQPLIDDVAEGPRPAVAPEDDATILFTSGSTGVAKGAVSDHRAVVTATYTFLAYTASLLQLMVADGRPPRHEPTTLVAVPLFHVTGAVPVMLNSFAIGRTMVLMHKWDAGEALRLIAAENVTYFVGVPTMSLELMQHPDRDLHDTSSLLDIGAGGAARPVSHVGRLIESFPGSAPMLGYGLTETNAVGCTNFRNNYVAKPASTGKPQAPFVDVAILDEDGAVVPPGERGEIGIRSRANFRGYWNNPDATAAAFSGPYFLTGDIGYLDPDGYLFIVDRAKDIIIRGGENISCQEVEAAIYAHPAVAEACVFGLPDDRLGEVPGAVVHLAEHGMLSAQDLSHFLTPRLAKFKLPERTWFSADPLPKLGTGKIDKKALRSAYGGMPATG